MEPLPAGASAVVRAGSPHLREAAKLRALEDTAAQLRKELAARDVLLAERDAEILRLREEVSALKAQQQQQSNSPSVSAASSALASIKNFAVSKGFTGRLSTNMSLSPTMSPSSSFSTITTTSGSSGPSSASSSSSSPSSSSPSSSSSSSAAAGSDSSSNGGSGGALGRFTPMLRNMASSTKGSMHQLSVAGSNSNNNGNTSTMANGIANNTNAISNNNASSVSAQPAGVATSSSSSQRVNGTFSSFSLNNSQPSAPSSSGSNASSSSSSSSSPSSSSSSRNMNAAANFLNIQSKAWTNGGNATLFSSANNSTPQLVPSRPHLASQPSASAVVSSSSSSSSLSSSSPTATSPTGAFPSVQSATPAAAAAGAAGSGSVGITTVAAALGMANAAKAVGNNQSNTGARFMSSAEPGSIPMQSIDHPPTSLLDAVTFSRPHLISANSALSPAAPPRPYAFYETQQADGQTTLVSKHASVTIRPTGISTSATAAGGTDTGSSGAGSGYSFLSQFTASASRLTEADLDAEDDLLPTAVDMSAPAVESDFSVEVSFKRVTVYVEEEKSSIYDLYADVEEKADSDEQHSASSSSLSSSGTKYSSDLMSKATTISANSRRSAEEDSMSKKGSTRESSEGVNQVIPEKTSHHLHSPPNISLEEKVIMDLHEALTTELTDIESSQVTMMTTSVTGGHQSEVQRDSYSPFLASASSSSLSLPTLVLSSHSPGSQSTPSTPPPGQRRQLPTPPTATIATGASGDDQTGSQHLNDEFDNAAGQATALSIHPHTTGSDWESHLLRSSSDHVNMPTAESNNIKSRRQFGSDTPDAETEDVIVTGFKRNPAVIRSLRQQIGKEAASSYSASNSGDAISSSSPRVVFPGWLVNFWLLGVELKSSQTHVPRAEGKELPEGAKAIEVSGDYFIDCSIRIKHPILSLVEHEGLSIVRYLCTDSFGLDYDEMARSLLCVFDEVDKTNELLEIVIDYEVSSTTSETTLFRSNNLPSKVLAAHSKATGKQYLKQTLGGVIKYILEMGSMEVDKRKLAPDEDFLSNLNKLLYACERILQQITESIHACPSPVRKVCTFIEKAVAKKFPKHNLSAIGGYIFLRYFVPAIVSPELFGVVRTTPDATQRRTLILISKVIQALANGVRFGAKEGFMVPMNEFLELNQSKVDKYLAELKEAPMNEMLASKTTSYLLHGSLEESATKLSKCLLASLLRSTGMLGKIHLSEQITFTLTDALSGMLTRFSSLNQLQSANNLALLSNFEEMLLMEDEAILDAMLPHVPKMANDTYARSALQVLAPHGRALYFLSKRVSEEIQSCENIKVIGEGTSSGARFMSAYLSAFLIDYLRKSLGEVISEVVSGRFHYEVDPDRVDAADSIRENMDSLVLASFKFFGCIVNSVQSCPSAIKLLCSHIRREVTAKFPQAPEKEVLGVVARMLFVRFICPAIAAPSAYGLLEAVPEPKAHRAFVLISYSLRHLSTGSAFRDNYMQDMNTFLEQHAGLLEEFVAKISSVPLTGNSSDFHEIIPVPFSVRSKALHTLRSMMDWQAISKMRDTLDQRKRTEKITYRLSDRIQQVLLNYQ